VPERYPSDCTDDLRVSDIFVVVNSEHVYVVARMCSEGSCGQGGVKVAEISTVQVWNLFGLRRCFNRMFDTYDGCWI